MAELSRAKLLGGIGSILVFIPFISVIGYILVIVAVRDISNHLQDKRIFRNMVVAAGTGIVGAFAAAYAIFASGGGAGLTGIADALTGLFIGWIFLVVSAVFLRRTYKTMSERLGVRNFGRAATLYLVGAGLTILVVGLILLFVAQIVQAIGYFSMPSQPPVLEASASPAPAASPMGPVAPMGTSPEMKFCTSCGASISPTATFCYNCGAKQA